MIRLKGKNCYDYVYTVDSTFSPVPILEMRNHTGSHFAFPPPPNTHNGGGFFRRKINNHSVLKEISLGIWGTLDRPRVGFFRLRSKTQKNVNFCWIALSSCEKTPFCLVKCPPSKKYNIPIDWYKFPFQLIKGTFREVKFFRIERDPPPPQYLVWEGTF